MRRLLLPLLPSPVSSGSLFRCLLFAFASIGCVGCGKPATQEECDEIVGRIAELELREASSDSPADVKEKVAETKQTFQATTKRECVGKRITEKALSCVRTAKTAEEIVHECLN